MYKPFSNSKNIDKMVRQITVFVEQETLEIDLDKKSPFYKIPINYGKWVKYVSRGTSNPLEVYLYYDTKSESDFYNRLKKILLIDSNFFAVSENYFLRSYQKIEQFTDSLFKNSSEYYMNLSLEELATIFRTFNKLNRAAMSGYYIVYCCLDTLLELVEKEIKDECLVLNIKNSDRLFKIVATVGINTMLKAEKLAFLKTLKKIQVIFKKTKNFQDLRIQKLIFLQWYDFGACVYAHQTNKQYSLKDYQKKFLKNLSTNADSQLKSIRKKDQLDSKKGNLVISKFKKSPQLIKHITWLRTMMGYRNKKELEYYAYFDHAMPLFDELAKRLGILLDDLWLLSKQEIIGGILDQINIAKVIALRKEKGLTIKRVKSSIKVFTGADLKDLYEKEIEKAEELKGKGAYPGQVSGKVKIILNPFTEGKKFKKGDILVTPMTTPYFVPLMKRAKAIVTDEGGLLSHAAIVARELRVPCIIGTKFATKILKNREKIFVDANHGFVRILK